MEGKFFDKNRSLGHTDDSMVLSQPALFVPILRVRNRAVNFPSSIGGIVVTMNQTDLAAPVGI
jgi:hypothetical protein